jgi:hypothetical protein
VQSPVDDALRWAKVLPFLEFGCYPTLCEGCELWLNIEF